MRNRSKVPALLAITMVAASCAPPVMHDLVIRNAVLYDGSGGAPVKGDVAVDGDSIAAVGDLGGARGRKEIDAGGLAVAPGFINMLSWATESLIADGRCAERHPPGRHPRGLRRGLVDGPAQRPR